MGESSRNYENGKIYCIRNYMSSDIYVGSTTQTLSKRMEKHRSDAKRGVKGKCKLYQTMNEIGIANFYIELIEYHKCNNKEELFKKEGEWIRKMATLNGQIQGRTPEQYRTDTVEQKREYDKQRREDKREELSEQQKVKYQNKKEHYKQKSSENYYNNKEAIREKNNAKCACECGVIYSYGNRLRHFNSKHHKNFLNNNIDNVWFQEEKQQQKKHPKQSTYNHDEL